MVAYRIGPHYQQFDFSNYTSVYGCTWTSGAMGAAATTNRRPNPDTVHAQVKNWEESNPQSPGWSMDDLALAMKRLSVPFTNRNFSGWAAAVAYHDAGYYLAVQGDSDQFGNNTCSGTFNGDHCIGVSPQEDESGRWLIDDPICKTHRWEKSAVIREYAQKLDSRVRFGQFTTKVPLASGLVLRFGAVKANPYPDRTHTMMDNVAVHSIPSGSAETVIGHIANKGHIVNIYQVTNEGSSFEGSTRWLGNLDGTRWIHSARLGAEGGLT